MSWHHTVLQIPKEHALKTLNFGVFGTTIGAVELVFAKLCFVLKIGKFQPKLYKENIIE